MNDELSLSPGEQQFQISLSHAIFASHHSTHQVGLLLIDFDSLEHLDGRLGNFSEQIWTRLRNVLRDSDLVVRMEGGVLGVLLPSINGADDVALVAKKILTHLQEPLSSVNLKVDVRPRVGAALYPEQSRTANALMQQAYIALNTAKMHKKEYVLYSQEHGPLQRAPIRMSQLRQAIVKDELFLLYQPKINLRDGSVSGVEALCRWKHPEIGLIFPDEFIPIAERTGLILPLTLWVINRSLTQWREWHEQGIQWGVAVNLSMWNLDAPELPEQINGLLKRAHVPAEKLELEITESAIMNDPRRVMRNLKSIRDLGISLAIDDFGTGYSSLAYLTKMPVQDLKIDKSFIQNLETDPDNAVIIRSIIDLGHNLGLKIIAEGVETRDSSETLQAYECDEAQGYYFSPPISAENAEEFSNNIRRERRVQKTATDARARVAVNDLPERLRSPQAGQTNGQRHAHGYDMIFEKPADVSLKPR